MTGWSQGELKAVVDHIRWMTGDAAFIDTSFPRQKLMYAMPVARWLLPQAASLTEAERFLADFMCNARDLCGEDLGDLSDGLVENGKRPWVYVAETGLAHWGPVAAQLGLPGLTHVSGQAGFEALMALPFAAGMRWMRFADSDGDALDFVVWLPPSMEIEDVDVPPAPAFATVPLNVRRGAAPITIKVRWLMSDCPWAAEGDDTFSWHWTGPGVTHRICLGDPPREFGRLMVHFMDHPAHAEIGQNLKFQINGRTVPANTDRLGEIGGSVQVNLPAGSARPLVLGVCAFPNARKIQGEHRHLRACITEVEALV